MTISLKQKLTFTFATERDTPLFRPSRITIPTVRCVGSEQTVLLSLYMASLLITFIFAGVYCAVP